MQFTEIGFAVFLAVVFAIYWLTMRKHVRMQNILLLAASYTFYGWWDWRFLTLIIITTASTFATALFAGGRHGKAVTIANITLNVGILATFKYLGFFADNLRRLLAAFGWNLDWFTIDVLLPVGISFYTFQAIAYSVDVYKRRISPCTDPIAFATFIAYFPQLVAGPIERAADLLPQLRNPRTWQPARAASGLRMILFGVMKKVCVADIIAIYVDNIYNNGLNSAPATLAAGILFSLQIYCDFSAYSEIARGTSRLLGIELMANFRFPYFSRNITEFWRRWHISLMMWFRDYIYIPLGGNRKGNLRTYFNIAVVFLLSGLWHGAAWNFIVWGAYWAVANIIGKAIFRLKNPATPISLRQLPDIILTLAVVSFGFCIFRCTGWTQMAQALSHSWIYAAAAIPLWLAAKAATSAPIAAICSRRTVRTTAVAILIALLAIAPVIDWQRALGIYPLLLPFILVAAIEWKDRNTDYPFSSPPQNRLPRWILYWTCMAFVLLSEPTDMTFIYFQF